VGNRVRLIGSPGRRNDIAFAHELIEGFAPDVTIADKGYDADHLCDKIAESGGQPVIPSKWNRTFKRLYDGELY
jgi:putative transposase